MKNVSWRMLIGQVCWLMAFCLAACVAGAAQSGDFSYEINPNGTVRIYEYSGPGGALTIPSTLDGRTVVGIGRYAFSASTNLTNVVIPDSVLYLEEYAFNDCVRLAEVSIGKGVNDIGFGVFDFCRLLTTITVDVGNTVYSSVGGVLFNKNQTTLIEYPKGKAGDYIIPAGVTNVGERAFHGCGRLSGITFPNGVASIDDSAFWGCTNMAFASLPPGLANIGVDAFWGCSRLTGITFPGSLTNIGHYTFYESGLQTVVIPASVVNIGKWAFGRCAGLTVITVETPNPNYSSVNGVLFNKQRTVLVQCPGGKTGLYATMPDTVTNIAGCDEMWPADGLGGFAYCEQLTGVVIPESVTRIGRNAFSACTGLTHITLPNSIVSIGDGAFRDCTGLADMTISERLTEIPYGAFASCAGLTNVTIPDSVTNIGAAAFSSCAALTRVIVGSGIKHIGEAAFWGSTNLVGVYFWGNAPGADANVFGGAEDVTVYCLSGTIGWNATFGDRPTALWHPLPAPKIQANGQRGTVVVHENEPVTITVTMAAGGYFGLNANWWVVVVPQNSPTWYYLEPDFVLTPFSAMDLAACRPAYRGALFNVVEPLPIMRVGSLRPGVYDVHFLVNEYDEPLRYPEGRYRNDHVRVIVQ